MPRAKKKIYLLAGCVLASAFFFTEAASAYKFEVFVVELADGGFLPQNIEIRRGQTVVFENIGQENHWPKLRLDGSGNSDAGPLKAILPGESWSYLFERTGHWGLADRNSPKFSGIILVKEDNGYTPGRPEEKPAVSKQGKFAVFIKNIFRYIGGWFFWRGQESADVFSKEAAQDEPRLVAYIKKFGAGKAISEAEKITSPAECHQTTHLIGRHAYKIFKNNAFQWHAFAFDAACNSGFFHGVMDEMKSEGGSLKGLCDNSAVSLKCAHDVGHSLMASGGYKLYDVLKQCEVLSQDSMYQEECFRGAFMENADGGINRSIGHGSDYLSNDPLYPCTEVQEKHKAACWQFAMGRFKILYGENYEPMLNACERMPAPYNQMCFASVGGVIAVAHPDNYPKILESCGKSRSSGGNNACALGAADELVSNPKTRSRAFDFCGLLEGANIISNCRNSVLASASRFLGENFGKFCALLGSDGKEMCVNFKKPNYKIEP